jgi:hypothetical protein
MAGETTVYYRFLVRSYTTSEWAAIEDRILRDRELGVELDDTTRKPVGCKFGNGSTPFPDLPYIVLGLGEIDLSAIAEGSTLQYDAAAGIWRAAPASPALAATMARISLRC